MSSVNDKTIPVYAGWIGSWQISVNRRPLGVLEIEVAHPSTDPQTGRIVAQRGGTQCSPHEPGLDRLFSTDQSHLYWQKTNPKPGRS